MPKYLSDAHRITIKIGSSLLIDLNDGLKTEWFNAFCADVADLVHAGKEIIIVSSGAVALGRQRLGFTRQINKTLAEKQAAAAVGQIGLAQAYQSALETRGLNVAQLLVTFEDTEIQRRFMNVKSTLETLLKKGVVPVFNENDTVATEEIRYGDNDRLSARIATLAGSECLILLSDIKGLYTDNPRTNPNAQFIPEVYEITQEIKKMAGGEDLSGVGTGGMITKILAGEIALAGGCHMAIADGQLPGALGRLFQDESNCTWFISQISPKIARESWLSGSLRKPAGKLVVKTDCIMKLFQGEPLVAAMIIQVSGEFRRGDVVAVALENGLNIGFGIVNHKRRELDKIIGRSIQEIPLILGYEGRDEIIGSNYFYIDRIGLQQRHKL